MKGTRCHDCADTHLAAAEETVCREIVDRHCLRPPEGESIIATRGRALDVGAGTSGAGRRILEGWDYTGIDPYLKPDPDNNIFGGNILRGPFLIANETCDLILCKRVLCQMTDIEVNHAVASMYDLLRPGGHLLVCEPWRTERQALCELRQLPAPASGGEGVRSIYWEKIKRTGYYNADQDPPEDYRQRWEPRADVPVAPDYVLWTRYFGPKVLRIANVDAYMTYDDPRRELYPAFPAEVQRRFAFYRARLWRKA